MYSKLRMVSLLGCLTLLPAVARCGVPQKAPGVISLPAGALTPDGMAVAPDGDLVVACPNFADLKAPALLVKVNAQLQASRWLELPELPPTGRICPMGIAFGSGGELYVCDNPNWVTGNGAAGEVNQGRILRLTIEQNRLTRMEVVAQGISHPNGIRVRGEELYFTVSMLPKVKRPDGLLVSAVYHCKTTDRNLTMANTLEDPNLAVSLVTRNRDCQYGADGLVFDHQGRLWVGNFGDGALHRYRLDAAGRGVDEVIVAKTDLATPMSDPAFKTKMVEARMRTTDGICVDDKDRIYVADFSNNAVCRVAPEGNIEVLAQSPDGEASEGFLDQPGEPIIWQNRLVLSCFDMVLGADKVNTRCHKGPGYLLWFPMPR